jgi:N utilization substance protein B
MTRSAAREIAVQMLFAHSFSARTTEEIMDEWLDGAFYDRLNGEDELYDSPPNEDEIRYIRSLVSGVVDHMPEIDSYIEKYSIGWQFGRIPRTASMAMRVAMYEVLYRPDIPNAAAINEAVEIDKHYDVKEVVAFVNGILGSFARNESQ